MNTQAVAPRFRNGSLVTDTLIIAKRNLLKILRTPQLLVFSSIQPIMFVLLFRYVFGGSIQAPGYAGHYADYLLPGVVIQMTLFGGASTAVGLAEDMSKGIVDRFRSLPMSRAAVLAGRTIADLVRSFFVMVLLFGVGYLVGFRFRDGVAHAIAAILLALLFGFTFSWFFALIGLTVKDAESAQVAGFLPIFPLVFAASTFTPIESMPTWLRAFARANPVTNAANAMRGLSQGHVAVDRFQAQIAGAKATGTSFGPANFNVAQTLHSLQQQASPGRYVLYTVLWCVGLITLFASLAIRRYRLGE